MRKALISSALLGAILWGCAASKPAGETPAEKSRKEAEKAYQELDAEQEKTGTE